MIFGSCVRILLSPLLICAVFTACNRDPAVLKRRYLESGNRYFDEGKYREARVMYLSALRQDSKSGEAYYGVSQVWLKLNKASEATPALRRAIELLGDGTDRDNARVELADQCLAYLRQSPFHRQVAEEADRLSAALLKRDPNSYHGHRIKGHLLLLSLKDNSARLPEAARAEVLRATAELTAANQIRPYQRDVIAPLVRCFEMTEQGARAEKLLLETIDHDKFNLAAYRDLRSYYLASRRFDDSLRILNLAIRNNPKEPTFLTDLAQYYRGAGKIEEAKKVIDGMAARPSDFPDAFQIAGDFYLQLGDLEESVRQYEKGIAAFPTDKRTYQIRLVALYMLWRRPADAERINNAILQEHPKDADAFVNRASIESERGDLTHAISDLETAIHIAPNNSVAHYNLGRALLAAKQPERARFQFSEAIRFGPTNTPARLALAGIQLDAGEYGKAVTSAEEALARQPRDPAAHLIRATGLLEMKKYSESRAELNAILAANPKHSGALFTLARLESALGKTTEAAAAYRKSYEANTADTRGLLALANSLFEHHQADRALRMLQAEVKRFPARNDLHLEYAILAERAGRLEIAIAELDALLPKALPNSQASTETHMRLAECYLKRKDLQAALTHIEAARNAQPDNPMVLHDLGLIYDSLGRPKEAQQAYEASLQHDGNNGEALNNLAYLIAEQGGDLDHALTLAQRARQKAPDNPWFADTLGWIYFRKKLSDNALDLFESSVRKNPEEPIFRYHLALALVEKGQTARARKELQKALGSHPSPQDAGRIKEQLAKIG
jgi:tetratricopeptide (TPR) repeat protein